MLTPRSQFITEASQCRTYKPEPGSRSWRKDQGRMLLTCCSSPLSYTTRDYLLGEPLPRNLENVPQASFSVDISLPKLTNWPSQFKLTKITNLNTGIKWLHPSQFKEFGDTYILSTGSMLRTKGVICAFTLELNVASDRPFYLQCRHEPELMTTHCLFCLTRLSNAC